MYFEFNELIVCNLPRIKFGDYFDKLGYLIAAKKLLKIEKHIYFKENNVDYIVSRMKDDINLIKVWVGDHFVVISSWFNYQWEKTDVEKTHGFAAIFTDSNLMNQYKKQRVRIVENNIYEWSRWEFCIKVTGPFANSYMLFPEGLHTRLGGLITEEYVRDWIASATRDIEILEDNINGNVYITKKHTIFIDWSLILTILGDKVGYEIIDKYHGEEKYIKSFKCGKIYKELIALQHISKFVDQTILPCNLLNNNSMLKLMFEEALKF
jgi:hypothetical protein